MISLPVCAIYLNQELLFVLFYSEASHYFISSKCIKRLNLEVDPLPTPMVVTAATDGSIEYGCHIRYGLAFFQFGISWMQRENGFHTTRKHGRRRSDICITR
jgi:hypothetical protein